MLWIHQILRLQEALLTTVPYLTDKVSEAPATVTGTRSLAGESETDARPPASAL